MPSGVQILLVVTFALVFARANVFAQGNTPSRTPVPLVAIDPALIERGLDSIRTANNLTKTGTRLVIDTTVHKFQEYCLSRSVSAPTATIVVKHLEAFQELACPQCEIIPNHQTRVDVYGSGVLSFDDGHKPTIAFSFHGAEVYNQPVDYLIPSTQAGEPTPSFWDSTLQPIIVTVGAAVIVALFFLIRS